MNILEIIEDLNTSDLFTRCKILITQVAQSVLRRKQLKMAQEFNEGSHDVWHSTSSSSSSLQALGKGPVAPFNRGGTHVPPSLERN